MEVVSFPCLLHLAVLLVSLCLLYLVYGRKSSHAKYPPGKTGWPIVGEMWELAVGGKPEDFIKERMRKYSPDVFQTSLFGANLAVFCGVSGNKFLFSNENKCVTSWWPRSVLRVLSFPEAVKQSPKDKSIELRSFLPEFLKPESLQHYIPVMDSMAQEHLEAYWSPLKQVKVFPLAKTYTFALACRLFISIKDPKNVNGFSIPFNDIGNGLFSVPVNFPGTAFNRAIRGSKVIHEEILSLIRQRKTELLENKDSEAIDLLSRILIASNKNGRTVDDKEIASNILGFLVASHDSTSILVTFVLNYLADHPHIYEKVLKEQMEIARTKAEGELLNWEDTKRMKYSWCVACEAMRLAPPALGTFREATQDFTYKGFTIPKGWKTHWNVYSTHKDPKYFPEPERFNPSRFEGDGPAPYTFVPFGGGPRICPGREYARLEVLVFMHNVVKKFKWEKVNPGEEILYTPTPTLANGLQIHLQHHKKW
ncbi:hypothetical protein Tsubulata_019978 [Turnera subulata]|uniref:Cytochrome P450 n=1 Tax=Turnera subulata TaxID=218843 RepID=A0A9Q0JLC7_9ROSI|nr:hypothetical protein Tsubulata_019978 [Turnera subulata]